MASIVAPGMIGAILIQHTPGESHVVEILRR